MDIENRLLRFLDNSADEADLEILSEWIKNPDNQGFFKKFVKIHYSVSHLSNHVDLDLVRKKLSEEIQLDKDKSKAIFRLSYIKYAAIILLFFCIGYFVNNSLTTEDNSVSIVEEEHITLEREDGTIEILQTNSSKNLKNTDGNIVGRQAGNTISYSNNVVNNASDNNTIKVPYGKRFSLVLSDSTKVFLNSGSSLRYPTRFSNTDSRQVFLVGEAYFSVTKDGDRPFLVKSKQMEVQVVGTEFNFSTYPEDYSTEVVLVEGLVNLTSDFHDKGRPTKLLAGSKAEFNRFDQKIEVSKVDTRLYTSWRTGELIFRNMPLKKIIIKLERFYNVTIINNNKALGEELFNASFKNESIENILKYLHESYSIEYTITNNMVHIN